MSNFLEFIVEDMDAKKTLFSTMPINTRTDIKRFNERISSINEKYNNYKVSVKKYLDTKNKSFNVKKIEKNTDELANKVKELEDIRFLLNPLNTYFEKMGFDNLIYELSNRSNLNFESFNGIISQFIDKFETAGIRLYNSDFDYTFYVYEYMTSFLDVRKKKSNNYDEVSRIFEKIYWLNPEIIEHIELNLRKLIRKYEKKFISYIEKHQKDVMLSNKISDYDDCLDKLKDVHIKLKEANKEDIGDIVSLAKSGAFDISNYLEKSKVRLSTYSDLMNEPMHLDNKEAMVKFYENLEKLKANVEEYGNYTKFLLLIDAFKAEYVKQIPSGEKGSRNNDNKTLKNIESQIIDKESKLEKLNKEVFNSKSGLFDSKKSIHINQLKIESIKQAKALRELYSSYDQEYFKNKALSILSSTLMVSDLLHLYYSFDYFKKLAIKAAYGLTVYEEIIKLCKEFDLFAMNPTNIIVNGILVFEKSDIPRIIMNKYRLDNVNVTEENLNSEDLQPLLDKIEILLRINTIEKSTTTVEKIWFMAKVEKFNNIEIKNN